MSTSKILKIISVFFFLFGFIFLAVGIGVGVHDNNMKKRCTEEVAAVVIENKTSFSDGDSSPTYSPVFRYTYNGKEYTKQTGYSSNPPVFKEGEKTDLFLDPSDPEKIYVPKLKIGKLIRIVFTVRGLSFVVAAA